MDAPRWLHDEPDILALLNAVLDRFDQQLGSERQRALFVVAERYLPTLASGGAAADQLWSLIGELQHRDVLSIRMGTRDPYAAPWQAAKLTFDPAVEELLRDWLLRPRVVSALQVWRAAVAQHASLFSGDYRILLERRIVIAGRTAQEVIAALAGAAQFPGPLTLRQLSTHLFWGDSKVLDERGDLIAALFPQLEIRERAIIVSVCLPAHCSGVLFIENQDTYTMASEGLPAAASEFALVYAAGFRSTAQRIRNHGGALLHYCGPGAPHLQANFARWWFDQAAAPGPAYFWGDLDFAGMQILKSLRERFGDVHAWSPGYAPMLERLRTRGGHGSVLVDEQLQSDPGSTGCNYADRELLPAIRSHGRLDQECFL